MFRAALLVAAAFLCTAGPASAQRRCPFQMSMQFSMQMQMQRQAQLQQQMVMQRQAQMQQQRQAQCSCVSQMRSARQPQFVSTNLQRMPRNNLPVQQMMRTTQRIVPVQRMTQTTQRIVPIQQRVQSVARVSRTPTFTYRTSSVVNTSRTTRQLVSRVPQYQTHRVSQLQTMLRRQIEQRQQRVTVRQPTQTTQTRLVTRQQQNRVSQLQTMLRRQTEQRQRMVTTTRQVPRTSVAPRPATPARITPTQPTTPRQPQLTRQPRQPQTTQPATRQPRQVAQHRPSVQLRVNMSAQCGSCHNCTVGRPSVSRVPSQSLVGLTRRPDFPRLQVARQPIAPRQLLARQPIAPRQPQAISQPAPNQQLVIVQQAPQQRHGVNRAPWMGWGPYPYRWGRYAWEDPWDYRYWRPSSHYYVRNDREVMLQPALVAMPQVVNPVQVEGLTQALAQLSVASKEAPKQADKLTPAQLDSDPEVAPLKVNGPSLLPTLSAEKPGHGSDLPAEQPRHIVGSLTRVAERNGK